MTWQTKVASWVIPLLADYVIPDDAEVIAGVDIATLDQSAGTTVLSGNNLSAEFPGLIPDYSLDTNIVPTTRGFQYNLKAKKAVGFYGFIAEVTSYNDKRLNKWTFPLVRRNFGYAAMSRNEIVAFDQPLHYEFQYHFSNAVQLLASNYDSEFSSQSLVNTVDSLSLNRLDVFLYPEVVLSVSFLPLWESWTLRFLKPEAVTCINREITTPPAGYMGADSGLPPPWKAGAVLETNLPGQNTAYLECANPDAEVDPEWVYGNVG